MILRRLSDKKVKTIINENLRNEDQHIEWKEIVTRKIHSEIIAFLNNGTSITCYLIIGIEDKEKKLVGVVKSEEEAGRVMDLTNWQYKKSTLYVSRKYFCGFV